MAVALARIHQADIVGSVYIAMVGLSGKGGATEGSHNIVQRSTHMRSFSTILGIPLDVFCTFFSGRQDWN